MIERLFPDLFIDSAYDIDEELLSRHGIKGLILDIDNTLVPMFQKNADDITEKWIKGLNSVGIKTIILSNAKYERAELFCRRLQIPFIHKASKPLSRGFLEAKRLLGLEKEEIAVVGDQIFTDMVGGNRVNMLTILVKPIDPNELFTIKLKRILEKFILFLYRHLGDNRKEAKKRWKRALAERLDHKS